MGKQYSHLTERDGFFLSQMLDKGYRKDKIAALLGVHRSTIYRETKRMNFIIIIVTRRVITDFWRKANI
jgi:IS30 family transposase